MMLMVYNVYVFFAQFRSGDSQASCGMNERAEKKTARHFANATPTIVKLEVRLCDDVLHFSCDAQFCVLCVYMIVSLALTMYYADSSH
jgi:hypothetical protein